MPIIACRVNPSCSGLVTATICITPVSTSRATRWRTAASDSPTAEAIRAYARRPSLCSCSMIALEIESVPGAAVGSRRHRLVVQDGSRSFGTDRPPVLR